MGSRSSNHPSPKPRQPSAGRFSLPVGEGKWSEHLILPWIPESACPAPACLLQPYQLPADFCKTRLPSPGTRWFKQCQADPRHHPCYQIPNGSCKPRPLVPASSCCVQWPHATLTAQTAPVAPTSQRAPVNSCSSAVTASSSGPRRIPYLQVTSSVPGFQRALMNTGP